MDSVGELSKSKSRQSAAFQYLKNTYLSHGCVESSVGDQFALNTNLVYMLERRLCISDAKMAVHGVRIVDAQTSHAAVNL